MENTLKTPSPETPVTNEERLSFSRTLLNLAARLESIGRARAGIAPASEANAVTADAEQLVPVSIRRR